MNKTAFVRHPREYTIIGVTCVIDAFVGDVLRDAYGGTFREMISVVEDGKYYHYQIEGERDRVSTFFLKKVKDGKIDLEKEYEHFVHEVKKYEALISQDPSVFSMQTILDFYRYYRDLIPIDYASMDSADLAYEVLSDEQAEQYIEWATRVRIAGEVVYKNGEMKFLPAYCKWLAGELGNGYTGKELEYVTYFEMKAYAEGVGPLPSREALQARMKSFYFCQTGTNEFDMYVGDEARAKVKERNLGKQKDDALTGMTELRGRSAHAGMVIGKARIIRTRKDMEGFEDGDIVVSPMTDPSYLPVMKRAGAFVTNEGGLLCHAAIVARELKKPCVIATKYATHVLRDGEWVEVDATAGVVRKMPSYES